MSLGLTEDEGLQGCPHTKKPKNLGICDKAVGMMGLLGKCWKEVVDV